MTSEGTQIRASRSLASIEAGLGALADDGTPVHHYLTLYASKPSGLASADSVRQQLDRVGRGAGGAPRRAESRTTTGRCCLKRRRPARSWRSCWGRRWAARGRCSPPMRDSTRCSRRSAGGATGRAAWASGSCPRV